MRNLILVACLILLATYSKGQQLVPDGPCYIYGEELICDNRLLSDVLSQNEQALYYHLQSQSSFKKANIYGVISIGGMVGGGLLIQSATSGDGLRHKPLIMGLGTMVLSCIIGTAGILKRVGSARQTKKAIDVFNNASVGNIESPNQMSLQFGFVNGNIGLLIVF